MSRNASSSAPSGVEPEGRAALGERLHALARVARLRRLLEEQRLELDERRAEAAEHRRARGLRGEPQRRGALAEQVLLEPGDGGRLRRVGDLVDESGLAGL